MGLRNFDPEFTEMPIQSLGLSSEVKVGPNYPDFSWNNEGTDFSKTQSNMIEEKVGLDMIEEGEENKMIEE